MHEPRAHRPGAPGRARAACRRRSRRRTRASGARGGSPPRHGTPSPASGALEQRDRWPQGRARRRRDLDPAIDNFEAGRCPPAWHEAADAIRAFRSSARTRFWPSQPDAPVTTTCELTSTCCPAFFRSVPPVWRNRHVSGERRPSRLAVPAGRPGRDDQHAGRTVGQMSGGPPERDHPDGRASPPSPDGAASGGPAQPAAAADQEERARALASMKRLATGLLCAMTAVFLVSQALEGSHPWIELRPRHRRGRHGRCAGRLVRGDRIVPPSARYPHPPHRDHPEP